MLCIGKNRHKMFNGEKKNSIEGRKMFSIRQKTAFIRYRRQRATTLKYIRCTTFYVRRSEHITLAWVDLSALKWCKWKEQKTAFVTWGREKNVSSLASKLNYKTQKKPRRYWNEYSLFNRENERKRIEIIQPIGLHCFIFCSFQ